METSSEVLVEVERILQLTLAPKRRDAVTKIVYGENIYPTLDLCIYKEGDMVIMTRHRQLLSDIKHVLRY